MCTRTAVFRRGRIGWIAFQPVLLTCASVGLAADRSSPHAAAGARSGHTTVESSPVHLALAEGRAKEALRLLEGRSAEIPEAERHALSGRAHLDLGEFSAARRELETAVKLRPDDAGDVYWLGRVLAACGSPTLAAARYERAHWLGMDSAELHHAWATALRDAGQLLGGVRQELWPEDARRPARPGEFAFDGVVFGPVVRQPGRVIVCPRQSALYQVYKSLDVDPYRTDSLLLCAEIWAATHRHDQAVGYFTKAAEQATGPDLARCHAGWAESMLVLGDIDAYLKGMRQSMQITGDVPAGRMARCYDRAAAEAGLRGELGRQIRYITFACELRPQSERLLALADAMLQANRPEDAVVQLDKALTLNPTLQQRRQIQQLHDRATYLTNPR